MSRKTIWILSLAGFAFFLAWGLLTPNKPIEIAKKEEVKPRPNYDRIPIIYDPEKCKTDAKGKVYIKAAGIVFAIPYEQLPQNSDDDYLLYQYVNLDEGTIAEHTKSLEGTLGCPDKPAAMLEVVTKAALEIVREDDRFANVKFDWPTGISGLWYTNEGFNRLQQSNEWLFQKRKAEGNCGEVGEYLIGCGSLSKERAQFDIYPYDAFQAKISHYQTPMGNPFTLFCISNTISRPKMVCSVHYMIYDYIGLNYHFDQAVIPVRQIVEFDKALRIAINDLVVTKD